MVIKLPYLNAHLGRLDNILDEDDGLEGGEQSVDTSTGVLHCPGQLRLWDPDVNVQECLVGKFKLELHSKFCWLQSSLSFCHSK